MGGNNNSDTSEKVLGTSWDCNSDKFIFCLAKLAEKPSQWLLLSEIF